MLFHLTDEPWIPVIMRDGEYREVSIREAFRDAPRIASISGDTAPQCVAIEALLEAVFMRAIHVPDDEDNLLDFWASAFEDWDRVLPEIEAYLDRHEERFFLIHPTRPFMQVPDLQSTSGNASGIDKLIPDLDNFFSTRQRFASQRLGLAEAARWLVHAHAYDSAGIRTGTVGDDTVSGGKSYGNGFPAWSGNLGIVTVAGTSFAEQLLLNVPFDVIAQSRGKDSVPWERDDPREKRPTPSGPADARTWQTRRARLLLTADGTHVSDVILTNGDKIAPHNMHQVEHRCSWRESPTQTKKAGHTVYMPVLFQPAVQVWRGINTLLGFDDHAQPGTEQIKPPRSIDWIRHLVDSSESEDSPTLPNERIVTLRAVGVQYGTNNSVIEATIDDALELRIGALASDGIQQVLSKAVRLVRDAVGALTQLADNLARAGGLSGDVAVQAARERAAVLGYRTMDHEFRSWSREISTPEQAMLAEEAWHRIVRQQFTRLGSDLCRDAGKRALIGRAVNGTHIDTVVGWTWFERKLWTVTDLAKPPADPAATPATDTPSSAPSAPSPTEGDTQS